MGDASQVREGWGRDYHGDFAMACRLPSPRFNQRLGYCQWRFATHAHAHAHAAFRLISHQRRLLYWPGGIILKGNLTLEAEGNLAISNTDIGRLTQTEALDGHGL
jgi:hypothetical protein